METYRERQTVAAAVAAFVSSSRRLVKNDIKLTHLESYRERQTVAAAVAVAAFVNLPGIGKSLATEGVDDLE